MVQQYLVAITYSTPYRRVESKSTQRPRNSGKALSLSDSGTLGNQE